MATKKEPYMTWEECVDRYPLIANNLQWVLIGSIGEAGCVIRDYRNGLDFSCEACSHSGLTPLHRIRHALTDYSRAICRRQRKLRRQWAECDTAARSVAA